MQVSQHLFFFNDYIVCVALDQEVYSRKNHVKYKRTFGFVNHVQPDNFR